jgi:ketosteroid isomerase-like protein
VVAPCDDDHVEQHDVEAVRAANAAFYSAFEAGDLDAMADVWEHSDRIAVTHPGWPTLRGWPSVAGSWDAIFRNTPYIQFVLTGDEVAVVGDVAWVTLDENILQATGGPDDGAADTQELSGARIAAVNVFVRVPDGWRMVLHHGSPVSAGAPDG